MTRPLNVLVLGVGGNVSQSIQKALALTSLPTRVVAACISPSSPGLYLADRAYISPLAASPEFVPWLIDCCEREAIDAVMSGSEIVLEAIAPNAPAIHERTGAVCIVSSPEVLRIGRDKLLTCQWLSSRRLPTPEYADLSDPSAVQALVQRSGFPLIAKPRFGKGGDGILTLRDEEDLNRVVAAEDLSLRELVGGRLTAGDLLLQEYLGSEDEEYTAGCFCDTEGHLRGTIVLHRALRAGTTVTAELGEFPEIAASAGDIARALGPLGPCNVQLRLHHGRPVPFEINPRFSGTTAMRAHMRFNEVEAALRHFVLGQPVAALEPATSGVALRYWNEIYVPAEALDEVTRANGLADPRARPPEIESWGERF